MLSFEKLEVKHVKLLNDYMSTQTYGICDYTPAGLMMWRNYFQFEISECENILFTKCMFRHIGECFMLPVCRNKEDLPKAIKMLEEYADSNRIPMKICLVPESMVDEIKALLGENSETITDDAWSDYIYNAEAFASLSGRKYNGQRNHINKFKKLYEGFVFSEISDENVGRVKTFAATFCQGNNDYEDMRDIEACAVVELFDYYKDAGMCGGIIEHNGKILALAIGYKIGDILYQHIEKALPSIEGSYQIIAQQFALHFASDCKYINREEDEGVEGLRRAKMANHPEFLIKKYVVSKG